MKNDPVFKLLAVVIIAGLIAPFVDTGSTDTVKLASASNAKVAAASHR